ncbi:MAG: hypothetical protein BGO13_15435 [Burkholderiales bacterium 66-5]|uniref:hypothetical protein n=1 Tax=Comamonas badia TaxID=265291 RepID=UPI0003F8634C|nr:hypothetical protein [Comamonas badia]OJU90827.1 MAG: hypothetical protein BGO13_15435 [Burkholderiales bacterium 66-5]
MKLFSFPQAMLEKAIAKRILSLQGEERTWFTAHWQQKPYKKAFIERKAMPLVTLVAKGKTWDVATFDEALAEWDVSFHEAEAAVLRPLIEGDGLLQLMQKNLPPERAEKLLQHLARRPASLPITE